MISTKFALLDLKLDLVIKSLSEVKVVVPSKLNRDNVAKYNSKVDMVSTKFASLDSKIDLMIESLPEVKVVAPSELDRATKSIKLFLFV